MTFWFSAFLGQEMVRSLLLVHEKRNTEVEKRSDTFKCTWRCCDWKCVISALFHWIGCGSVWVNVWVGSGMWRELCISHSKGNHVLICNGSEIKKKTGSLPQIVWGRASLLASRAQITGVPALVPLPLGVTGRGLGLAIRPSCLWP